MVETGSDLFKSEMLPLLKGAADTSRFEIYRSTSTFRLSSLGPHWREEVRTWNEKARLTFVAEILHIAGPLREMAVFALGDPSLEVRTRAFSELMWMNADDETTRLLMDVDEPAFEAASRASASPLYSSHIPNGRATGLSQDPGAILRSRETIDGCWECCSRGQSTPMMHSESVLISSVRTECEKMDQRELRPLLDALSSDQAWRSRWIVRRVLEGALNAEQWSALIDPLDPSMSEQLLERLESEDVSRGRGPGVKGLFRLNADAQMAQRIFLWIVELHRAID